MELGSERYDFTATYNGEPAVPMGIYLQPGANALETATRIYNALDEMAEKFPAGLEYEIEHYGRKSPSMR